MYVLVFHQQTSEEFIIKIVLQTVMHDNHIENWGISLYWLLFLVLVLIILSDIHVQLYISTCNLYCNKYNNNVLSYDYNFRYILLKYRENAHFHCKNQIPECRYT